MGRLGTETAMAISVEASAYAAGGNRVFPFHLGDLNLPTPAPVREAARVALEAGHTGYCPAPGIPSLREALAADVGGARGLERIRAAAELGDRLGLPIPAGHGLHYHNVQPVAAIETIIELNIGHSIIARAIYDGLGKAVADMKSLLQEASRW